MTNRPRRRWLALLPLALLTATAPAAERVYRATLDGRIGLTISVDPAGDETRGEVRYDASGAEGLRLAGRGGGDDGGFEWREILETHDGAAKPAGTFTGALTEGGRRGAGEWRSADGRKRLPLMLERAARIEVLAAADVDAKVEYPVFDAPGLARLNARLAADAGRTLGELGRAVREQREALKGEIDPAMLEHLTQQVHVELDSPGPELVSVLHLLYDFSGGAHGNTSLTAENYALGADGTVRAFGLWNALQKTPAARRRLSALLVAGLKQQGAAMVVDGEIKDFDAMLDGDGGTMTVIPAGIAFHFPPYAVGPYAQGMFRVVIPNRALAEFVRADGPLAARAAAK